MNNYFAIAVCFAFPAVLFMCWGIYPAGLAIVKDQAGAYTFTDGWGRTQEKIIYSYDLAEVQRRFGVYLRENNIERHWSKL